MKQIVDKQEWDRQVLAAGGHPLQLWGWGEVKSKHGWKAYRYYDSQAEQWCGAQVLIRPLPRPFKSIAYVPRGPVGQWSKTGLERLSKEIKQRFGSVLLAVEPDATSYQFPQGWRKTSNTILVPQTVIIDLSQSEEEIMAAMTKKTRQYIRKSINQVKVRLADSQDLETCIKIYRKTAQRANFALHGDQYYRDVAQMLGVHSPVYVAVDRLSNDIVAFLWLAASKTTAFELYGGVTDRGQELRANYALKWQAMQQQRSQGVKRYDMNGLLNDGISNFKRAFSSAETTMVGTYDRPLSVFYVVWTYLLPTFKKIARLIRKV